MYSTATITSFTAIFASCVYFIACFILDIRFMHIPNKIATVLIYIIMLCYLFTNLTPSGISCRLIEAAILFGLLYLFAKFLGLGGGDVIVLPIIPLFLGIFHAAIIIFIGCIGTTMFILIQNKIHKVPINNDTQYPLLPGVCIAYIIFIIKKILVFYCL